MSSTSVHLADQGCFWVGVDYEERDGQSVVDGSQLYVEFQKPQEQTQPFPVVLIHGGGGQGLDWMATPDGRPGWRTLLLQRGYAVYVVDRPGHGRCPRHPRELPAPSGGRSPRLVPSVEVLGTMFAGPDNPAHTQWPGSGRRDDPALAQLLASQSLAGYDPREHHALMRRRGGELLDIIGPAILITNSAGGPAGWLMTDERPGLVQAVVALEPLGPSGPMTLRWGITASPITYDPPAPEPGDLELVDVPAGPGGPHLRLQPDPPRRLPHLADIPIAVVSGEQSFANPMDVGTVAFLRQAGCTLIDHLRLGDLGVHGNGHLMMIERNNEEVLDIVTTWLDENARREPGT
jgi:pimeloyl-ACP methyl ester carboxylesterase